MIETKISKDIWKLKYRYKDESELEFYSRPAEGLFKDLDDDVIKKYLSILGVKDKPEMHNVLTDVFANHRGMLAGRPMYSLGTERFRQTLSNCFVIPIEKDSMEGIMKAVENSAMTMKAGGGVGYNFSILRPKYSRIHSSGAQSTGVLSFMNIFNTTCSTIEAGGNRRGAQIAVLGIWHPDVLEYITCKRKGDGLPDEYKPYKNFNLSLYVSDEFMEAVRKDELWELVFPDTTCDQYGEEWDGNIKLWKEKGYPVEVHNIVKARELWDKIMRSNYDFAEPGILFEDTINNLNTLWMEEYILACNPCVVSDTLVTTNKGDVPISLIINDGVDKYKVLTYNTDTGEIEYENIVWGDKTRKDTDVIEIELESGQVLKLTPDHKVYTENRGYVKASLLTEEDEIILYD